VYVSACPHTIIFDVYVFSATSPYIKTTGKGIPEKGYESDLVSLRPTLMVAVPSILDLITSY
jgi:hypothetical protein